MKQKKGGKKGECGSGANMQRNVKDRLFRFLFEYDREALLQLYNALNGTEYRDVTKLQVVTIESAVYVVMKNDLAFVVAGTLNMYEHQSTDCPNLPARFFFKNAFKIPFSIQSSTAAANVSLLFLPIEIYSLDICTKAAYSFNALHFSFISQLWP